MSTSAMSTSAMRTSITQPFGDLPEGSDGYIGDGFKEFS